MTKATETEVVPAQTAEQVNASQIGHSALTVRQPSALAVSDPESILRFAIEQKADVSVIERMMVVRDKLKAENAQMLFDQAMQGFRAECRHILKTKGVSDNSGTEAYRYAPFEQVEDAILPYRLKYGFRHRFPKMICGEKTITVTIEIKHEGGHFETAEVTYRIGTKTRMMSDTQVDAATESFAKRRALINGYGLVTRGEDRDGRDPEERPKPRGPMSEPPGQNRTQPQQKPAEGQPATAAGQFDDNANKRKLVELTKAIHFCKPDSAGKIKLTDDGKQRLGQWLLDDDYITDTEKVEELTGARLDAVVRKLETKLRG